VKGMRVRSILVWPGSEPSCALKEATRIAVRMHSRVKIVNVMEEAPGYLQVIAPQHAEIARLARRAALDQLRNWVRPIQRLGIKVNAELLTGNPVTEIVYDVLRNSHDLVVISAGGDDQGCGSAAIGLMRKCPCPVWATRPARSSRRSRILAAVDTVPSDGFRASLNAKVAKSAATIASALGGELHVLHAWQAYGETLLLNSVYGSAHQQLEKYFSDTKSEHWKELQALLKSCRINLPASQIHLLKGDSRLIIPAFCKSKKIDLLVMGTVARTGVSAAVMGNTAEFVANRVDCSVLAIKPETFVCPLKLGTNGDLALAG
jgi:universal stress protein E